MLVLAMMELAVVRMAAKATAAAALIATRTIPHGPKANATIAHTAVEMFELAKQIESPNNLAYAVRV